MNTSADNHDDGSELQAVMGAYFDALLHPTVIKAVPTAARSDAQMFTPMIAEKPVVVPTIERAEFIARPVYASYQLIQVGGLTLGITVDAIATAMSIPTLSPVAASAPVWALGTYVTSQGLSTVVDTALLLMPDNARGMAPRAGHVLQLKEHGWALACDAISTVLTPDPAQVTWRGVEGKRPWLAGTLRTPACALLDMAELIKLLQL